MGPILILRHSPGVTAGYLGDVLADDGLPVATAALDAGGTLPDRLDWSAVVVLGGMMGAYDVAQYPFLAEEKSFLRRAVDADIPVLGICLGCQMLADALGGRAYLADQPELGFMEIELTDRGRSDPVIGELTAPVIVKHQDTWDLPPGGELLAVSDRYPQAFRLGSALGLQPHAEVTPETFGRWLERSTPAFFEASAEEPRDLLHRVEEARERSVGMARRLFSAWLAEVRSTQVSVS